MSDNGKNRQGKTLPEPQVEPDQPHAQPGGPPSVSAVAAAAEPMRDLECPAELPPLAKEEWNRIVGELVALGVLSKFDRGPLAIYCGAYAAWAEAMMAIQEFGMMIKSPSGYPVQSPYVAIVNRQADMMVRIAGEFGFTPAARYRSFSYSKSNSMLLEMKQEAHDDLGLRPQSDD